MTYLRESAECNGGNFAKDANTSANGCEAVLLKKYERLSLSPTENAIAGKDDQSEIHSSSKATKRSNNSKLQAAFSSCDEISKN